MQHSGCQNKKVRDLQNCQKEGELQSEGSLFPLFLISFFQLVLFVLGKSMAQLEEPSLWSPVCKYRILILPLH